MASFDASYYLDILYPLQDEVLATISSVETGLYLSGGTAISRGYLHHRFSEDLDLFADDASDFRLWSARLIDVLAVNVHWHLDVMQKEERLVRMALTTPQTVLKIELINDVPSRIGTIGHHPVLGRLDCTENLLANKISALIDRDESKDMADIWGLCIKLGMPLKPAIEGAQGKAAGIFVPDCARALCSANESDWEAVLWQNGPSVSDFLKDVHRLGEDLLGL